MEDLWPDGDDIKSVTKIKAPVTIVKEQAVLLGEKTDNIVTARVVSYVPSGSEARKFHYFFYIEAPILAHYSYELFAMSYDIELYPIYLTVDESIKKKVFDSEEKIIANSEAEFIGILRKIFNSDKTKKLIGAILSQSSTA